MRRLIPIALVIFLSGCVGQQSSSDLSDIATQSWTKASSPTHVVTVLIDTGIQPYHDAFKAPPGWVPPNIPGVIRLGDDFRTRALETLEAWNELEKDQLYYFEGTRVFAMSKYISNAAYDNPYLIYDDFGTYGHGMGTASLVAQIAPRSTVLMIEAPGLLHAAWQWVVEQSWIDIVSVSQGPLAGLPDLDPGPDEFASYTQQLVANGKLVVFAAGNEPMPKLMDYTSAPWTIVVGGAQNYTHGEAVLASKVVDVVANIMTDQAATKQDMHKYVRNAGTSFSAPVVAGVLSEALFQIRERYGDSGLHSEPGPLVDDVAGTITNDDFRAAMNATAMYWTTTDYSPLDYPFRDARDAFETTVPVLPTATGTPVGPWVQMGWGSVDESLLPEIVSILTGEKPVPEKPPEAQEYMRQVMEAKTEYWKIRQRD